jgi:predicted ribosome quality control (RQC) complex YloA/Tae2 family protein
MKQAMSNMDIRLMLDEIREAAEGAFIKNVYQYGDVFVLKLYKPAGGTTQLLIEPGHRVHLTEYRRAAPRVPSKYCTVLRKYLRDRRIHSMKQHELDRIVVFEVGDEESSHKLVAELFGSGNILLLDPADTIFVARRYRKMRDRDVMPKAKYEFPPPRGIDLLSLKQDALDSILADSNANVVRTLASRLNLDSLSCEEICALAGVKPTTKVPELDGQAINDLKMGIHQFIEKLKIGVKEPRIVIDDNLEDEDVVIEPTAFLPFEFEVYRGLHNKTFDTFSQAIDDYFGVSDVEQEDEVELSALVKEKQRLQKIIDKQEESISRLVEKSEKLQNKGELIYANFQVVQDVLETVTKARSGGLSWLDIIGRIEEGKKQDLPSALLVVQIVPSQAEIIARLNETDVQLDIRLNAQDNASIAYDQSKKARSKVEGARKQIMKTKSRMEQLDESYVEPSIQKGPVKIRKKRWYEKFRWFISSENFLVLGGRDAKTNEQLAKRQMSANDVFLHASVHGAPYVIIKVPEEAPGEQTLKEAAQFAVTFSRAWQDGLSNGDAYWVNPEQVSFTPPSGEYLPSGAVMMYGTKNFIRKVPVELAVGLLVDDATAIPMSGPPTAVASQTEYFVRITPADKKKGQLVKELQSRLRQIMPEEQANLVGDIPQEDLMRVLPAGGGKIAD